MNKYEVMYIIRPEADEEAVKAVSEKLSNVIASNQGEVEKFENIGKRRLAYEIDKIREGIYGLIYFNGTGATVAELDRIMKIDDQLIRHMIVREDD